MKQGQGKHMLSHEIRDAFLQFFRDRDHTVVPSSSLVPVDDPTLLFTNAGMVQFKDVFLGREKRSYSRATTCQKCVRAGGKHNDLENVGFTQRHHTFLEMLGNFSFGDYFKEQAIVYAWEFLTKVLDLPKDKLYVTVFREDDEAETLWRKVADLPSDRIVRMGEKDNFWSMGDTGPCGPCSEIIIDRGSNAKCGSDCALGVCDCDRWLELWNLVFMQFMRDEQGTLTPLPKPSIDTGMGLERITSVLQGKTSAFDTDLFVPIIEEIEKISGKKAGQEAEVFPFRVIADHARACAFLASDGVMPSNEGRGYVMRRILRRAVRFGLELGITEPFIYRMVPVIVEIMGSAYPELSQKKDYIGELVRVDEVRFQSTLQDGQRRADSMVEEAKANGLQKLSGRDAFILYDTFGFPIDLTKDVARKSGIEVDEEEFADEMRKQRERSRKDQDLRDESQPIEELVKDLPPTAFTGYDSMETEASVVGIIKDGNYLKQLNSGQEGLVILNTTPFYAVSGGQESDTGYLLCQERRQKAEVLSVTKTAGGVFLHRVRTLSELSVGDEITAKVNGSRRSGLERHHTATHLLHEALRQTLGEHVRQSGSLVQENRLRFDYTHFSALTDDELKRIEDLANQAIMEDLSVSWTVTSLEQARKSGAIALFDEKYGEKVRVVEVSDFSKELCGGTHVKRTGQIGQIQIVSDSAVASGIRRIEAVAGASALVRYQLLRDIVDSISKKLGVSQDETVTRIDGLLHDFSTLRKEAKQASKGKVGDMAQEIMKKATVVAHAGNLKIAKYRLDKVSVGELRSLGDRLKELDCSVVILGSLQNNRCSMLVMVKNDALELGIDARDIVKKGAAQMGGSGGGKPTLAQAGGKDPSLLDVALETARKEVLSILKRRE
jgi:alanyl-tRNA synthetase